MMNLKDLKFISNDHSDYIRRLEREYEKLQEENKKLKEALENIEYEYWNTRFKGE